MDFYFRYIDDLIFICEGGGEEEVESFITDMHRNPFGLAFDGLQKGNKVVYFDLILEGMEDGSISSNIHRKFVDGNQYLHATSCHPPHVLEALPFGELVRVSWLCSDKNELVKEMERTNQMFFYRGYDSDNLKKAYTKIMRKLNMEGDVHTNKRMNKQTT